MKRALVGLMMAILLGCAGGQWQPVVPRDIVPEHVSQKMFYKDYQVGVKKTVGVGQEMIRVKTYNQGEAPYLAESDQNLQVKSNYRLKTYEIMFPKGSYPLAGYLQFDKESWASDFGRTYYVIKTTDKIGDEWGILMDPAGETTPIALYSYRDAMLYSSYHTNFEPKNFKFTVSKQIVKTTPTGSIELLFSGKNDTSINALYREYSGDDLVRPAFAQTVTYQPDSKQIRFKNFLIEISDINNQSITFTVVEDGLN